MAKGYEDLSRRALIQLGKNYDQENDAALLQYLTEHSDEYENIRPVEKAIQRADQLKSTAVESADVMKKTFYNELVNSILGAISDSIKDCI